MKSFVFTFSLLFCTWIQAQPRTVFVQLFEWPWLDVATECETYLGPNGFAAVQVSPPQEHLATANAFWWERYQPVSYKISSRSGTEAEFISMINRCQKAGVDVYVDAVINHMSGFEHGAGFAATHFTHYDYPGLYSFNDFHHCNRNDDDNIYDFYDRYELFNCELLNLADLNTASLKVQTTITAYLNHLIDLGVKGFRIDAAKHMDPHDLFSITSRLKKSPYIIQELITNPGEPISYQEYSHIGDMNVFAYPFLVAQAFKHRKAGSLKNLNLGLPPSDLAAVFIDNHDLQRVHERSSLLTYQQDKVTFRLAQVFMLTWPYGYPQVFSGYDFTNFDQGPAVDQNLKTTPVLDPAGNCQLNWTCEHRLPEVAALVKFRNQTDNAFFASDWWSNGANQLAFSRGRLGFVAINNSDVTMERELQSSLPPGRYCNLLDEAGCSTKFEVDENSVIKIRLLPKSALVVLASSEKVSRNEKK